MRLIKICSIVLAIFLCLFGTNAGAVQINALAPDFSLKDLNGKMNRLSKLKGRVIILNFWSTTCPPCVAELPSLNALYHDLAGNGLLVLGIALDTSGKSVREMAQRLHIEYPLLLDSSQEVYFDAYGLFGQPVSVLIDRAGIVREKIVGQVEWASPEIRAKINKHLRGGNKP